MVATRRSGAAQRSEQNSKDTATPSTSGRPAAAEGLTAAAAFLAQLATKLQQQGKRAWKAPQVAVALQKALGILPAGSSLRRQLEQNIEQSAEVLLRELQQAAAGQQEPSLAARKPAKRAKKGLVEKPASLTAAAAAPTAAEQSVPISGTLLDAGLEEALAAAMSAAVLDAEQHGPLLLARQPAPSQGLSWFLSQAQAQQQIAAMAGEAGPLLEAAALALPICSSLAGQATCPEEALACYAPVVSQLRALAERLLAGGSSNRGSASHAQDVQQLTALAARAITALQLELSRRRLPDSTFWQQWQTPQHSAADAARRAADTCAALVLLRLQLGCTALSKPSKQQGEALAAKAALDLQHLAPFAAAGQLSYLGAAPVEELAADRSILPLYAALSKQECCTQEQYLPRVLAARKVAAAAEAMEELAEAVAILAAAERLPSPAPVADWLRLQAPSAVVVAALAAAAQGPEGLSRHLVRHCSLDALHALVVAQSRTAVGEAAPQAGQEVAEEGDAPDNQLLFFDDKEGNPSMFGGDWGEESEEEGGGQAGLDLAAIEHVGSEGEQGEQQEDSDVDSENE